MKTALVLAMMIGLSGCVTTKQIWEYPEESTYTFTPEQQKPSKDFKISDIRYSIRGIDFRFENTGSKPVKIIWNDSAIVIPGGESKKVFPVGTKFIDATREIPDTLVHAKTSVSTGVSRTDNLSFSSRWSQGPLVACGSGWNLFDQCNAKLFEGKEVAVILALDVGGKRTETRIVGKLGLNPKALEIAEQYRVDHEPKQKQETSSTKTNSTPFKTGGS